MQQADKELPESCQGVLERLPEVCPWRSQQIKSGRHKLSGSCGSFGVISNCLSYQTGEESR